MIKEKNTKKSAWINMLFFITTLAINALGSFGFINGMSQKDISDKYHTLITPAPKTFSIWGVIYTLVLISLVMMIIKEKEEGTKKLINTFTPFFILSSLFNIFWIILFSYDKIGFSVILILALLTTLILICKKIPENDGESTFKITSTAFGLYAGWLTIASVVNLEAYFVSINWDKSGISPTIWAPIILLLSLLVVILINLKIKNTAYPLAVAWAFYGIYMEINNLSDKIFYGEYMKPVLIFGIIVLLVLSVFQFKNNNYSVLKNK